MCVHPKAELETKLIRWDEMCVVGTVSIKLEI